VRTHQKHPAKPSLPKKKPPPLRRPMSRVAYAGDDGDDPPAPQIAPLPRMIPKAEVLRLAGGVTFPTVWRWMKDGTFPMSFDVGGKVMWREDEIANWLRNQPRSRKSEG
jgi:predicted DNA-binding transcriptional regulator AlpA